ncbi:MAG: indolepyruvate ferredoxin oxidoreductase subunit alpha [Desulfovibrionales bacterium]
MAHTLLSDSPGSTHLLLGNEAIVRGALEAGVGFVSCYPGTPSSEIPDTFYRLSPEAAYIFEYSVNEKVALEVGGGAALTGVPTMVTMKHVGVNVAADALMSLAYMGTTGGLVLISADDPGCHSSQNEQDNRYYARLAGLPCFEPSTAQEAKDMARDAMTLSAQWNQPVMLRTTTRLNHLRGGVVFGDLPPAKNKGSFVRDTPRYVIIPAHARVRHAVLLENLEKIRTYADNCEWNRISGQGNVGCIASGVPRTYLRDAVEEHGLENRVKILELGLSYPFPKELITSFLRGLDKVLVLEELEPILENDIRVLCQKNGIEVEIIGKGGPLGRLGEYDPALVENAVCNLLGEPLPSAVDCTMPQDLPGRPPNLCAGCTHRAAYLAVREVFGDDALYSSDIGCYTLGLLPPLRMADFLFCMGSSVSAGSGAAKAGDKPVVAFIGDSTFFHSGITGLVNAVYNNHDLLIVILDNRTTAMTGHQPHPGVDHSVLGPNPSPVDITAIVKGCGVKNVRKVKPSNLKGTRKVLEELKAESGVRVLVAEEPCPLFARKALGKKFTHVAYITDKCENRRECLERLACPAFYVEDEVVRINQNQCTGCMLCLQVCPNIKARKRS